MENLNEPLFCKSCHEEMKQNEVQYDNVCISCADYGFNWIEQKLKDHFYKQGMEGFPFKAGLKYSVIISEKFNSNLQFYREIDIFGPGDDLTAEEIGAVFAAEDLNTAVVMCDGEVILVDRRY